MSLVTGRWVEKQGKGTFGNKWQKRWIVQDGPFLKYFLSPQHVNPQGQIDFSQVEEVRLSEKGSYGANNVPMYPFEVVMQAHLKRVYSIRTDKQEDREFLVGALQALLNQCKTGSAPASAAEQNDPAAREQATLDELDAKIKELSKEVEGRVTLRRFYTDVQAQERVTKDKDGNVTSSKTVEVKKRIMDKECLLDITSADIINLEFTLDALKADKAAHQAKNLRISFKVDNSMYGVLAKQWEELGSDNGCDQNSHISKWQNIDVVLPNLLYRPEVVKSSGLFSKLITDLVKNTFVIPVAVTFDLDALHERAKAADADTPSVPRPSQAPSSSDGDAPAPATAPAPAAAADAAPPPAEDGDVVNLNAESSAVAGDTGAPTSSQAPPSYDQAPPAYDQPPPSYDQPPAGVHQAPPGYNQAPPGYNQAPPGFGQPPPADAYPAAVQPTQQAGFDAPLADPMGGPPMYPPAGGMPPGGYPPMAGQGAPPGFGAQAPSGAASPAYPQAAPPYDTGMQAVPLGAPGPYGEPATVNPPMYGDAAAGGAPAGMVPPGVEAPAQAPPGYDLAEPQLDDIGPPPPFEG